MKKKLFCLSLIAIFCTQALANTNPIPFLDHQPIQLKQTTTLSKLKNKSINTYVNLNELDLSHGGVHDSDIPNIIAFLKANPAITSLNLEANHDLTSHALAKLASVKTLKTLNLARHFKGCVANNCTGGLQAKDVAAFAKNTSLTSLNLSMNSIGDEGAVVLANNVHLTTIDVSQNNLSDVGGLALAKNKSLKEISLSDNEEITSKTAVALSENTGLRQVELSQTHVDDEGAIALANKLHLDTLGLADNNITDKSANAFADNKTIKKLNLAGTQMTAQGAKILSANTTLTSLEFAGDFFGQPRPNDIGDVGAAALAQIPSLEEIGLSSQQITHIGAAKLIQSNIISLDLTANYDLGDQGAAVLGEKFLSFLDVSACTISDKGGQALAKSGINMLFAESNFIGDVGVAALADKIGIFLYVIDNNIHDEGAIALAQKGTMAVLFIGYNHIGVIGRSYLEHAGFDLVLVGSQFPVSKESSMMLDHDQRLSLEKAHPLPRKFCYRDAHSIRCINKHDVILPAKR